MNILDNYINSTMSFIFILLLVRSLSEMCMHFMMGEVYL